MKMKIMKAPKPKKMLKQMNKVSLTHLIIARLMKKNQYLKKLRKKKLKMKKSWKK